VTAPSAAGKEEIGLLTCLAFAVGTMVGSGSSTRRGRRSTTPGRVLLAYLLAGLLMLLSALSFVVVTARAGQGLCWLVAR
jgi:hypothetical protein